MGLFGKGKSGGLINVIRCDEQEYLVWKWRPERQEVNSTSRENSIRYGSSLRVKDGEVAVFVYKQQDGPMQDFIIGPYDGTIKTANFPILASIVGSAFGGESPFQAEIYFINLAGNVQIKFGIPYFDVFDPRFLDFGVPMAVRGTLTFNITDYKGFIKLNRMINFSLDDFSKQIKDAVTKYVKQIICNCPTDQGIPVLQIERKMLDVNNLISAYLENRLHEDFGVNMKGLDIAAIEVDKESDGYKELRAVTSTQTSKTIFAQTDVNIKNLQDIQNINAKNMEEILRIQQEESQRAQRLQTESEFLGTHALDQQADVLKTAASNLGEMGSLGNPSGMNPAGLMTGMMMGSAMGGQMANMLNQMGQQVQQPTTPPPPPVSSYMLYTNGSQSGPYNIQQLQQFANSGLLTQQTYVWKQGMANWEFAGQLAELAVIFASQTPPPPPTMP